MHFFICSVNQSGVKLLTAAMCNNKRHFQSRFIIKIVLAVSMLCLFERWDWDDQRFRGFQRWANGLRQESYDLIKGGIWV